MESDNLPDANISEVTVIDSETDNESVSNTNSVSETESEVNPTDVENQEEAGTVGNEIQDDIEFSFADFEEPLRKRRKRKLPEKTNAPTKNDITLTDQEDTELCPICFDPWTSSGDHRLCCLKCGHLFGYKCIEKWLSSKEQKSGSCPQCNMKAGKKHIRFLYCKNLKAIDTTERDQALAQLETEKKLRQAAVLESVELKLKFEMAQEEVKQLRDHKRELERRLTLSSSGVTSSFGLPPSDAPAENYSYKPIRSLNLSESGKCRVMCCVDYLHCLCVSQPSKNPLFKGFGIRKLDLSQLNSSHKFLPLHSDMIRCLAVNPLLNDGLIASASMDKTVKLTSLFTYQTAVTFPCDVPVWSCEFSRSSNYLLYAGLSNGLVLQLDLRQPQSPLATLNQEGRGAPVVALQCLESHPDAVFQLGGVFVAQLNKVTFLQEDTNDVGQFVSHILHGGSGISVMSMSLNPCSQHLLTSYRPSISSSSQKATHNVEALTCEPIVLDETQAVESYKCQTSLLKSFMGGQTAKQLVRSSLFKHPKFGLTVAASNQDNCSVQLWSTNQDAAVQTLVPSRDLNLPVEPILDVCCLDKCDMKHLALLTEKNLAFYEECQL